MGRGTFDVVLFAKNHHLVSLVRLSNDDRGVALECPEGGPEVARKVMFEDGGGQLGESLVGGVKALFYEGWGKWLVGEGPVVGGDVRDAKVYRVLLSMFGSRRGWAEQSGVVLPKTLLVVTPGQDRVCGAVGGRCKPKAQAQDGPLILR